MPFRRGISRSLSSRLLPISLGALTCVALLTAAETAPPPAPAPTPAPPTVAKGVYTADQNARGKKAYQNECARCHGETLGGGEDSPALVGKQFLENWTGKTLG